MSIAGFILVTGGILVLLLLGMLLLESAMKLHLAWRFRGVVDNACRYPDCLLTCSQTDEGTS